MTAYLPIGYRLTFQEHPGEYVVTQVISRGASTIVYAAEYCDEFGNYSSRILKEYYPEAIPLRRGPEGALVCKEPDQERFQRGKEAFIAGGQSQNEVRNRVRLQNETPFTSGFYLSNNTVYLEVAPFNGFTLDKASSLTLVQRMKICLAVAKLVKQYHVEGFLCLDIKPSNLFILKNSSDEIVTELIEYIDFDSIRRKEAISFGNCLSFTEEWAAPEQKTPYGYKKICEATDVYAIGELAFWLLFDRHSLPRERRAFSQYPYDEQSTEHQALKRYKIRNLIQSILHNSIRPSISNRFASMDNMIALLTELVGELSRKQTLITTEMQAHQYFYGRQDELDELDNKLAANKIVFVSGIPGIGKSELVKQYIHLHRQQYDNILLWTYDGDLDSMVSWDSAVKITNFSRLSSENDAQFANRKLEFLKEYLNDQNNLVFVDNIDRPVEELKGQDTLSLLFSLPGKIIVGTRATEALFPSIRVAPLSEHNELAKLFTAYCPSQPEEIGAVHEIIDIVGHHTLLVELMAHYSVHRGPMKTLKELHEFGIAGLQNEEIRLLKGNSILSESVSAHINRIFSMDSISDEQMLTLAKLAILPTAGLDIRKFAAFFAIENYSDVNWLISHGWVNCEKGVHETILLHPTISGVVIDRLKAHPTLLSRLYIDCYDAIRLHRIRGVEPADEAYLANAIALATTDRYRIMTRQAGIFLQQYAALHSAYGNKEAILKYVEHSINLLEADSVHGKYSALLEYSYRQKASALMSLNRFAEAEEIAHLRLPIAKKAKDLYTIAQWYNCLSYIYSAYHPSSSEWLSLKYYLAGVIYATKLGSDAGKRVPRFFNAKRLLDQLGYDYMEKAKYKFISNLYQEFAIWMENQEAAELFCSRGEKADIGLLKRACHIRVKVDSNPHTRDIGNSFEIRINKARIAFLEHRYDVAERLLHEIVAYAMEHQMLSTSTLYRVHQFLGHIALRRHPADRNAAISEFNHCLHIANEMENSNTYAVRLELGYQYLKAGDIAKAKPIVMDLWQETRALAHEIRKTFRADALRNMAFLHLAEGSGFTANNMLKLSFEEYDNAIAPDSLRNFEKARAYVIKAEIVLRHGKGQEEERRDIAVRRLEIADALFIETVGTDHPDSIDCRERLEELRNNR